MILYWLDSSSYARGGVWSCSSEVVGFGQDEPREYNLDLVLYNYILWLTEMAIIVGRALHD